MQRNTQETEGELCGSGCGTGTMVPSGAEQAWRWPGPEAGAWCAPFPRSSVQWQGRPWSPLVRWHQKGDKPAHRMTANVISLDLKGHTGLFTALSGTLCDYCPSLCTLPVMAFACGDGGLSGAGPSSVSIPCGDSLR